MIAVCTGTNNDVGLLLISEHPLTRGLRLPGQPSCCLYEQTPFLVSDVPVFVRLI